MTLLYIVLATLAGGLLSVLIAASLTLALLARVVRNLVSLSAGVLLPLDSRYRFRHHLVQQALIDQVPPHRQRKMHRQIAARLAELDREEAAWKNRIAQYQVARQQILQSGDSAAQQQAALQQLQMRQFSAQERPRLTAYEGP